MNTEKPKFKNIKINPLAEGYHFCLGCIAGHDKKHNWKTNLIHFGVSLLLIIIAPTIFGWINGKGLDEIRSKIPYAQYSVGTTYDIGTITEAKDDNFLNAQYEGDKTAQQKIKVNLGSKEKIIDTVVYYDSSDPSQKYKVGDQLVVRGDVKKDGKNTFYYMVEDKFRVKNLIIIAALFLIFMLLMAGIRGLSSVLGLVFTIIVIIQLLIPQILLGADLFWLTGVVSLLIASTSLYLAHGFNRRTTISMIATVITILITLFIANWAVDFALLSGFGSDDAFHLKGNGITSNLNLRGLLISGIVIGSLGILDDVTTAQAIAIEEISKANPKMKFSELFFSGMRIGQEHIISLINTLALAYVGTSMPLLLTFTTLNFSPIWVILNNQIISEELIRTLVGSACLILAIPVSTLLAARFLRFTELAVEKKIFSFKDNIDKIYE